MQHNSVAALDVFFQGTVAITIHHNAKVTVIQRILAVNKGQIAIRNARFHTVAFNHKIEIILRVLYAGVFCAVIFLKSKGIVPCAHRPHNRNWALGILAERALPNGAVRVCVALQAKQHVCGSI